jgi:hypothetical protein
MPHLELSLRCRAKDEPWLERALTDLGAMSVTLLDPQADTTNEQAILEPGVGETPLWADCLVVALFDEDVPREPLLAALETTRETVAAASGGALRFGDLVVEHGKGSYVWDTLGRRYLDMTSGIGVTGVGHCHPKLVEAAASHGFAGVAAVAFCTALSPVLAHAPRGVRS